MDLDPMFIHGNDYCHNDRSHHHHHHKDNCDDLLMNRLDAVELMINRNKANITNLSTFGLGMGIDTTLPIKRKDGTPLIQGDSVVVNGELYVWI